jgi:hypothetical protein
MTASRTGVCYNPFDMSIVELGKMAVHSEIDYAFCMYAEVMLNNVDKYLPRYIKKCKITITTPETDELVCQIAIKLLELPLITVKLMLSNPKYLIMFMIHFYRNLGF